MLLLLAKKKSGGGSIWQQITGSPPLTLLNAKNSIFGKIKQFGKLAPIPATVNTAITQYGKCVQDGTPTSDAPVDIVCNNGALKFGKSLTLDPTRYYAYVGTSNYWAYSTDSYSIVIPVTVGKKYRITADPTTPVDGGAVNIILRWGFVDTIYDNWKQTTVQPSMLVVRIYDWVRSTPQDTQNVEVTATHPYMILQMGAAVFASNLANGRIGVAVQEIYTDGTPEVLTVGGQNLVDLTAVTDGYYYDPNGVLTEAPVTRLTDYIPVRAGQKYTLYVKAAQSGVSANVRCNLFNSVQEWMAQSAFTVNSGSEAVSTITPTENGYLRVSANATGTGAKVDWSTLQIVRGEYTLSTMPPYEPYHAPQTITGIPMLLGVGDYKDEIELIGGIKTGKVGIKVFDGTENWRASSSANIYILDSAIAVNLTAICTHFQKVANNTSAVNMTDGTFKGHSSNAILYFKDVSAGNVDGFKARLASQYAAGTPVIMLYALATETTEQTTAYPQLANSKYVNANVEAEVSDISVVFTRGQSSTPTPYASISYMCNNGELKVDSNGDIYAYGTPEELKVSASGVADQIASVANLLAINNDYRDAQDIIGGLLTHKVGIYVFNGTEAFTKGTAFYTSNTSFLPSKAGAITPICTHFQGISSSASRVADSLTMTVNGPTSGVFTGCVYFYADRSLYETAADFKAWLASEYAAGTPVIVFYPLATEVEESVAPQALTTAAGTNTVSVTSNVDPVELDISYKARRT